MRYPAFVAEMGLPRNRHRIYGGVWAGYLIVVCFVVLALSAVLADVSPYGEEFAVLLAAKLVINTAVLVSLRREGKATLELMALNMSFDVVGMTAAIYYTGGPSSPLFAIYVIEVSVTAMLANAGVTALVYGGIVLSYGTMTALMASGVLPPTEALPIGPDGAGQVLVAVVYALFVVGVPFIVGLRTLEKLREREASLEARTAELIEAGKQRSVFLASVTHELRTPIHGVQGLSDLIASGVYGPVTDKQKDAAAAIKRSSQNLLQLVDDLLALVRAEVGRLEVMPAEVDVSDVVAQVVASVQWMLGTKQLTLRAEIEGEPLRFVTDRRLLGHILVNLVANAAKFTPEGGAITVRARRDGERLAVEVDDTGIGIPEDKRAVIFEPFRQLDASDERAYGGVGLGLALVKRLCDGLGGEIRVDSQVDRGSTFTVTLPPTTTATPPPPA